jgi:hypothetical protein
MTVIALIQKRYETTKSPRAQRFVQLKKVVLPRLGAARHGPKVRKIPPPLVLVLILGVFTKVRKTPPINFAHLESPGAAIGLRHQVRKTPPLTFAHLMQIRDGSE